MRSGAERQFSWHFASAALSGGVGSSSPLWPTSWTLPLPSQDRALRSPASLGTGRMVSGGRPSGPARLSLPPSFWVTRGWPQGPRVGLWGVGNGWGLAHKKRGLLLWTASCGAHWCNFALLSAAVTSGPGVHSAARDDRRPEGT